MKCPKCNSNLNIEIYKNSNEIDEGILKCEKCQLKFPIIDGRNNNITSFMNIRFALVYP